MTTRPEPAVSSQASLRRPNRTGRWIAIGLLLGIACGLLFGEYCAALEIVGEAYVGLLQMTVLPYLMFSLVANLGRLDLDQARRLGLAAAAVLLLFWAIGVVLIVVASTVLPPVEGASFFSPQHEQLDAETQDALSRFIPTNVFRSLSLEYVPAVVLFCVFFGVALMLVPGKQPLLDFLDVGSASISRINLFLVRLAPLGLFTLSAAAAGTMHIEELHRLQAYLIMFVIACLAAAFCILPLLISCLTPISYREALRSAQEPLLTAIATGKLLVVLPQIAEKCEQLMESDDARQQEQVSQSTASIVTPLAYSFPHLGKILTFVFVSFAAWYVGRELTPAQTAAMGPLAPSQASPAP